MKKIRIVSLALALAVSFAVLVVFVRGLFQGLESQSIDFRFKIRGDRVPNENVVIITADEKSIAELGRWPWSRATHGRLIKWLTDAGAKAIAFDILFTEPDNEHPQDDVALGRLASKSGRVVFGMFFQKGEDNLPAAPLLPIPPLRNDRIHMGSVNFWPEVDGVTRKLPVWMEYDGQFYPSLSLSVLAVAEQKDPQTLFQELNLPTEDLWNEFSLNFAGGFQMFPYFSYADVLKGRVSPAVFKDKIVFVGGTATALFDFKAVPNVPLFPGLEIHAVAVDNYLNGNHLRTINPLWTILLILVFGLGCGLLLSRVPAWAGALSTAAWIFGYYSVCQVLFSKKHIVLDFVAPATVVLGTYVVVLFYRFLTEQREKRWIKGTFSQYLSPKVIEVITSDPGRLRLGGEEREMTVFFSDLAGFTSISEAMKPPDLVAVLNEYLTAMSEIILKYDGVVDKYIGDAIMAFWNAPVDQPRHAVLACLTALEQMERLAVLQRGFAERKLPAIDCRIGINTGNMVVGNMGSKNRFDYTVMGDSVNLASRLEGANKPYHTRIMISEFTYEKAKNDIEVRQLDLLRVKGKAIPIKVYELIAAKGRLTDNQKKAFASYEEGLAFYLDRKFEKAAALFKKTQALLPHDGPSDVYLNRCAGYLAAPPPKDWDGVYVMTTK
ncbi:MAG TPA: adenylate/guanylate cyclase domain-containing protein [Elusimicrobiota bacterium]|nr:adenylate/guanylate cyclase domain-containing protein [Elusimicrobiota bacterium]